MTRTQRPDGFYEQKARTVSALAHPVRLAILDVLADGEATAGTLVETLDLPQPLVSQHLARLRAAGVVEWRREGTRRLYRLADPKIARACGLMSDIVVSLASAKRQQLRAVERAAGGP